MKIDLAKIEVGARGEHLAAKEGAHHANGKEEVASRTPIATLSASTYAFQVRADARGRPATKLTKADRRVRRRKYRWSQRRNQLGAFHRCEHA